MDLGVRAQRRAQVDPARRQRRERLRGRLGDIERRRDHIANQRALRPNRDGADEAHVAASHAITILGVRGERSVADHLAFRVHPREPAAAHDEVEHVNPGGLRRRDDAAREIDQIRVEDRYRRQMTVDPGAADLDRVEADVDAARGCPGGRRARLERSPQAQLAGPVLLQHHLRAVDRDLGDLHREGLSAHQRSKQGECAEARVQTVNVEHQVPFGIEHPGVDVVEPGEPERAHAIEDDLPLEGAFQNAIHARRQEPSAHREVQVNSHAAHRREREGDAEARGAGDGEHGATGAPGSSTAHQKASPIPNENASGTPKNDPASASTAAASFTGTCSPGIR